MPDAGRTPARAVVHPDVIIARKLFFAGCAFLPWLWILCLMHYRRQLFDKSALPELRFCACGLESRPPAMARAVAVVAVLYCLYWGVVRSAARMSEVVGHASRTSTSSRAHAHTTHALQIYAPSSLGCWSSQLRL